MANYKLVVLSNPVAGREDEYNDWYNNQHLKDVVAVPGFVGAQRFKLSNSGGFDHQWQYIALYEMETEDPGATFDALMSLQGSDAMYISPALDLDGAIAGVFETCSALVASTAPTPV